MNDKESREFSCKNSDTLLYVTV